MVRLPPTILIVDEDIDAGTRVANVLSDAGYHVTQAATFKDAARLVSTDPPDLLITEFRLGAFNGLHLMIKSRARRPEIAIIVLTGFPDPVLAAHAAQQGATVLVKPVDASDLLAIVRQRVGPLLERRRAPRKLVHGRIAANVAARPAQLLDFSYEGFQIEVTGLEILSRFELELPALGLKLPATAVWRRRRLAPSGALRCGAKLADVDTATIQTWRELVDKTPAAPDRA
jgi:DNA-binding response OmpR family regulator